MTDMTETTHKSALVTGAGKRIGRAIAEYLADTGWAVCVHYNASAEAGREVAAGIIARGGAAQAIQADLGNEAATAGLIGRASQAFGPLGLLVNNASRFEKDDIRTASRESWDAHMEANLRAPFVLTQGFAAQLGEGTRGNIINIIDQRVWNLTPQFASYTLSKAGLWTLTQTAAMALAPAIRVNAIGPGPALPSRRQSAADFERQWRALPLQRPVEPAEIARAVGFILDAPSMTGQMIALDSGQHLVAPGGPGGPDSGERE